MEGKGEGERCASTRNGSALNQHRRWSPSHRAVLDDMEQIIWDDLQKLFRADLQELQHKHCRRQSAAMQILSAVNSDDYNHHRGEDVVGVDIDLCHNNDSGGNVLPGETCATIRWTALQRNDAEDQCDIGASISNLLSHDGRSQQQFRNQRGSAATVTRERERNSEKLLLDEQRQRYIDDEIDRQRRMREITELRRRHGSTSPQTNRRAPPMVAHPFQVALHHLLVILWLCVRLSKKVVIFLLIYVVGFLIMCSIVMPSMVDFYGEVTGERIVYVHPLDGIDWLRGYDESGSLSVVTNLLKVLGIVESSTANAFSRSAQNPSLFRTYDNREQHDAKLRFWTAFGGWEESNYPSTARNVKRATSARTPRPSPSIAEMDEQYARTSAWHTMKHGLVKAPIAVASQPPVYWFRKYLTEALSCPAGGCNGTKPVRLAPVGM